MKIFNQYIAALPLLFILLFFSPVRAQQVKNNFEISGTVAAAGSKEPVSDALVTLRFNKMQKQLIAFSLKNGQFNISGYHEQLPDSCTLEITALSYQKQYLKFFIHTGQSDLGNLILSIRPKTEDTATVTANRIKADIEKISYEVNLKDYPTNTQLPAVLRNTPLLSVDGQGNIRIQGKTEPVIFLNGRQVPREQVMGLTHDMISRVEVINMPSASSSGETEGIVNIVTRRIKGNHVKGSVGAGAGLVNESHYASGNLMVKKDKYMLLSSASWFKNLQNIDAHMQRRSGDSLLQQNGRSSFNPLQSSGNITLFYDADTANFINLLLSYNLINETRQQSTSLLFSGPLTSDRYSTGSDWKRKILNGNAELEYRKIFKNKGILVASGRLAIKKVTREVALDLLNYDKGIFLKDFDTDRSLLSEQALGITFSKEAFKGKKGRFDAGLVSVFRHTSGDFRNFIFDSSSRKFIPALTGNADYVFNQDVQAAYVTARLPLKKYTLLAGLRYEHTFNKIVFGTDTLDSKQSYNNLLPSLSIGRTMKDRSQLRLAYNKRIKRPGWSYLNPFNYSEQVTDRYAGNSRLLPEIRHRFELSYSKSLPKNSFVFVSAYFTQTTNTIYEVAYALAGRDVLFRQFYNLGNDRSTGVSLSYSAVKGKINLNFSGYAEYNTITVPEGFLSVNKNEAMIVGANISASGTLLKKYYCSFFASYTSLALDLQSRSELYPNTDISVTRNFFRDRLSVNIRYQDLLNRASDRRIKFSAAGISQDVHIKNHITNLFVSVTWNFGRLSAASKRRNGISIDDVKADAR